MGAFLATPKTPKPDPAAEADAARERVRAERDRLDAAQNQLAQETQSNAMQFGKRPLLVAGQAGYSRSHLGG